MNPKSFILQAWSRWSVPLVTIRRRCRTSLSDYNPIKRPETGIEPLTFLLAGPKTEIYSIYFVVMLFQWSILGGTGFESFSAVRARVRVLDDYCPIMPALFVRGYTRKNTLKCALRVILKGESHDRADDDCWWRNFRMSRAVCSAGSDTQRVRLRLRRQTLLTFIWSSSERAGPIPPESPFSHTRVSLSSGIGHAHAGERSWVAMATNRR